MPQLNIYNYISQITILIPILTILLIILKSRVYPNLYYYNYLLNLSNNSNNKENYNILFFN
jgi:hypothetical protein